MLGITSPTTKFSIPPSRASEQAEPLDGPSVFTIPTPRSRQRKLSQSNANPRMKKGAGKKLALFEGNTSTSIPGRLGMSFGGTAHSSTDDLPPPVAPGPNFAEHSAGHDRPYRFSFYSNALSATIHARSLSELPADGQTFEDLFTGLRSSSSPPQPTSMFGPRVPQRGNSQSYFPEKGVRHDDSEGSTWWLDVQSPTDEEMKMLSKVCVHCRSCPMLTLPRFLIYIPSPQRIFKWRKYAKR